MLLSWALSTGIEISGPLNFLIFFEFSVTVSLLLWLTESDWGQQALPALHVVRLWQFQADAAHWGRLCLHGETPAWVWRHHHRLFWSYRQVGLGDSTPESGRIDSKIGVVVMIPSFWGIARIPRELIPQSFESSRTLSTCFLLHWYSLTHSGHSHIWFHDALPFCDNWFLCYPVVT